MRKHPILRKSRVSTAGIDRPVIMPLLGLISDSTTHFTFISSMTVKTFNLETTCSKERYLMEAQPTRTLSGERWRQSVTWEIAERASKLRTSPQ